MKKLSCKHIIMLQQQLVEQSGGSYGIRDNGLLDSAVNSTLQSFDGEDLYPTTIEKGVRLGYNLIKNHPFVDGNKRIGAHAMLVFLHINNISLSYTNEELIKIILDTAASKADYEDLLIWVQEHIV